MRLIRTPKKVELAITNKCNSRCKYCYFFDSADDVAQELSTQDWLTFFEELERNSVLSAVLLGGEPFLRPDFQELIQGLVRANIRFTILSNGSLITDEMASFLASTRRCDMIQVSIDGASAKIHDASRGPGRFEASVNGIKFLKKHYVGVSVRVTLTKLNLADLENVASFLLEELSLPGFSINDAFDMGLCRDNFNELRLSAVERSMAMEVLLRLSQKYGRRISATAGPLDEARHWIRIKRALRHEKEFIMPRLGTLSSCGISMTSLAVRADGVIVPCQLMPHIELGRVNKDDLTTIWQSHPTLEKLRLRRNIPLNTFASCKDCEYIEYCAGGCPAITFLQQGDEYLPNTKHCLRQFLADGGELPEEKLLLGCLRGGD